MASRTLVTHALPYANGSLHLGHMVESVQTDVFVRAMNAMGKECLFICADDTHGTPIEISARKAGVAPEDWITRIHGEHAQDYKAFEIGFDLFYTTHSPENEHHARRIYEALRADGAIEKRDVLQMYCGVDERFLPEIRNFVDKWLAEPLRDWDISRDAPYFGFRIPGEREKYFYVWFEAPVGYLSSTDKWCQDHGRRVEEFWGPDTDCDIVHFIGKDIVYFHTLFWPAMLHASRWKEPARVHVHGMLTVEGAKMSKSRGTFLNVRDYLDAGLDPEWIRYFYAANLGPTPSDIDLSLQELKNRVNGELLAN